MIWVKEVNDCYTNGFTLLTNCIEYVFIFGNLTVQHGNQFNSFWICIYSPDLNTTSVNEPVNRDG